MSAKKCANDWIETNKKHIIKISDELWDFAELGLIEHRSSKLIRAELERQGFHVESGVAGMPTALIATWGKGTPVIGIMGEYDALPGLSQKRSPKQDPLDPGKPGHGCGHNIHGTSGMAATIAVKVAMDKCGVNGSVKFYGCPAEENFSGKVFMVRDGYFDVIDAVISHHPYSMNEVSLRSYLAVNSIKFHFYGVASHAAASPEQGRSALDAVELMNTGVNFLREHLVQDARVHYVIEKGGDQPNIVPSYARSWYYIRAPERDQTEFIYNWILDIAKGAAMMTRTQLKTEFMEGIYNLIPNKVISELIVENMRELELPKITGKDLEFVKAIAKTITKEMKIAQLKKSKRPAWEKLENKLIDDEIPDPWGENEVNHGSTDVSDVSWQAPTVEFSTATWILGTPAHSWQAVAQSGVGIGHKSLIFASKVMANTVIDLLTNKETLARAKEEYKSRTKGKKYRSPIPQDHKPPLDIWDK